MLAAPISKYQYQIPVSDSVCPVSSLEWLALIRYARDGVESTVPRDSLAIGADQLTRSLSSEAVDPEEQMESRQRIYPHRISAARDFSRANLCGHEGQFFCVSAVWAESENGSDVLVGVCAVECHLWLRTPPTAATQESRDDDVKR
jgi:hypothetical protein